MTMPTWLKAALITSAQTFLASAFVTLTGLLAEIQDWINDGVEPHWSNAAKLLGSAAAAAASGVITGIWRALKPPEETYSPQPPPDQGEL